MKLKCCFSTTFSVFLILAAIQTAKADKLAVFPFCPKNTSLQSERMNNLHLVLMKAASSIKDKQTEFVFQEKLKMDCESHTFRTLAASLNSDIFLDANYLIEGDTIELRVRIVFTKFVDKAMNMLPIKGNLNMLNDCISASFQSLFKELKVIPSASEWNSIVGIIAKDGRNYGTTNEPEEKSNSSIFLNGKSAFETENYKMAKDLLGKVLSTDENYNESLFLLGKTELFFDNYNKAYLCFRKCSDLGYADNTLDSYLKAASALSKPAEWFNTVHRRKAWWETLNSAETKEIIALLNNLKINGKSYTANYIFDDNDISKLFKTTLLPIRNQKIQNLSVFRYFTDVDVLILENTKLSNDDGIQYFFKLKYIRTDSKLELPQISFLSSQKKLTIIRTTSQK